MSALLLLLLILLVRAAFITLGPENTLRSSLAVMSRSAASFERLAQHIVSLEEMMGRIDQYSLQQIRETLATTTTLVGQAGIEFQAQQDAWRRVQKEIAQDKISFFDIKEQLALTQKLQDREILRLRQLLTDSTRGGFIVSFVDLAISFAMGVLSSLLATHLYARWKSGRSRR